MREGLRSQKRVEKPESSERAVQEKGKGSDVFDDSCDEGHEGEAINLTAEERKKLMERIKELERQLFLGSSSANTNLDENSDCSIREKGEGLKDPVMIDGGVPSASKTSDDCVGGKRKLADIYEPDMTHFELNWVGENEKGNDMSSLEEQDQLVQSNPPNDDQNNDFVMALERIASFQNRTKGVRSLTTVHGVNMENEANDGMCPKSAQKKEVLKDLGGSQAKGSEFWKHLETETNAINGAVGAERSGRSKTKFSVSEQIANQLSDAGWVIFFRPSIESEKYDDAVYVSPEGKAHWSLTLAYNTLKHHCEAGDGEGKVYGPGFRFKPIPEEDMNILTGGMAKNGQNATGGGGIRVVEKNDKVGKQNDVGSSSTRRLRDRRPRTAQRKRRYDIHREKRTVITWMIDMGAIQHNERVLYMDHEGKCAVLDGRITRDGILCGCCNGIVSISKFEAHSRLGHCNPLTNIHVERGASLMQCMKDAWNRQDESYRKDFHFIDVKGDDHNDDVCSLCGEIGDLMCCDGCPSTFHPSCLGLETVPLGDWYCIHCRCKFCGLNGAEQIDNFKGYFESMLYGCRVCEERYHKSCLEASFANIVHGQHAYLCGDKCKELCERFERLLGVKHEINDGFYWTILKRSDIGYDDSQIESRMVECNSKLAVALSALSHFNVELLILPAIPQLKKAWIGAFGFEPIDTINKQLIKKMNMLVFPHTDTLQKKIPKCDSAVSNRHNSQIAHWGANNWSMAGTSGSHFVSSSGNPPSNAIQINDRVMSAEPGSSRLPLGPSGATRNARFRN
ncbi:uncharacterized protein LOC113862113 [Abrus precatorius]|uniref:Uncharacterized protein LOC113862113 n=1 Tax=Abrus precatorius TaxID=3816 RepID=A0A8B8L4C2_ABRPR|nr:uncharacterized protein LOC113862113 [Abrus precatorius]